MSELHQDIKKAIDSGVLEGIGETLEKEIANIEGLAKVMYSYSRAFEKAGFSEIKAIKAVLLLINYDNWKDE